MNRYSAQKQYWKAKQTKQDKEKIADVVLLQKLQVCARRCALRVPRGPCSSALTGPWRARWVLKPQYARDECGAVKEVKWECCPPSDPLVCVAPCATQKKVPLPPGWPSSMPGHTAQ